MGIHLDDTNLLQQLQNVHHRDIVNLQSYFVAKGEKFTSDVDNDPFRVKLSLLTPCRTIEVRRHSSSSSRSPHVTCQWSSLRNECFSPGKDLQVRSVRVLETVWPSEPTWKFWRTLEVVRNGTTIPWLSNPLASSPY